MPAVTAPFSVLVIVTHWIVGLDCQYWAIPLSNELCFGFRIKVTVEILPAA